MDLIEQGNKLLREGKRAEAIDLYDQAINLNPENAVAYYMKAAALHELGKNQEAVDCYDKAINLNPADVNAYYDKGNTLNKMKKYQEAVACYNKAIDLNPDHAGFYVAKGLALTLWVPKKDSWGRVWISYSFVFLISRNFLPREGFLQSIFLEGYFQGKQRVPYFAPPESKERKEKN